MTNTTPFVRTAVHTRAYGGLYNLLDIPMNSYVGFAAVDIRGPRNLSAKE